MRQNRSAVSIRVTEVSEVFRKRRLSVSAISDTAILRHSILSVRTDFSIRRNLKFCTTTEIHQFVQSFRLQPELENTFHLNLFIARNKFEIPNTYDQQTLGQDQRQRVKTINIAPGFVHIFNHSTVLTISPYFRLDQVNYYPSANPFADQSQTVSQQRRLANAGIKADIAYVKGIHNIKFGGQFQHTFLNEGFQFGITDSGFNPLCFDGKRKSRRRNKLRRRNNAESRFSARFIAVRSDARREIFSHLTAARTLNRKRFLCRIR